MAVKTTIEQLEEVQAAITAVMGGQSVTLSSGQQITRANLKDLEAREQTLLDRYKAESGSGGLAINIGIPRRTY